MFPTSLIAQDDGDGRVFVLPEGPGSPAIERLARADRLAGQVARKEVSPDEALTRLLAIEQAPGPYPRWAEIPAAAGATASTAAFLGGGWSECGAAAVVGAFTWALAATLSRRPDLRRLTEAAVGCAAAVLVHRLPWPMARDLVLLAGVVVFLPGYSLTTALTDLATGHRVSGASGLAAAAVTLLQLAFGVAIGARLVVPGAVSAARSFPTEALPVIVLVSALSFAVLLQIRPRWLGWVVLACGLAVVGEQIGRVTLGPDVGAAIGALALALLGSFMARFRDLPLAVTQVPGLWVLVPGVVGFRAIQALVAADISAGIGALTAAGIGAIALVGGSLLGSAAFPPRRAL